MDRILLVEDEKNVGSTLVTRLEKEAFQVTWVKSVQAALSEIDRNLFEMAIVDVGLPDGSGFEIGTFLRERKPNTALIFLTAFGTAEDRIRGLELGAEDYVVKPFHLKELILRIKNGLKRVRFISEGAVTHSGVAEVGKAKISFPRFQAELNGRIYPLTHKETAVLKLLVENRGQVVSRDQILDQVWSEEEFPTPRTVDNFIVRLRRLVEDNPESPEIIKSIRGIGYQLL